MKDCTGLADANSLKLRPSFATIKTVKAYNRTHIGCRQERVFAERKSHRSIRLFIFCDFYKLLRKCTENVKPYNRTHIGRRQECVYAEGKFYRSIYHFTFCTLRFFAKTNRKCKNPITGRIWAPAKSVSLRRENLTVVNVSLHLCALHEILQ